MRCPRCDALVTEGATHCSFCGQDLSVIYYVRRVSNTYYNIGLERARVRDLTGAVEMLKKALSFDKENHRARNLLGLVYYEMGETVQALSEWVLSKYLVPDENEADYFINTIQDNQVALDATNQTIKKYNAALESARAGNEDLAIIQLKKVVSLNPHFIRAAQLLALLYMMDGEYGRAYKVLQRIAKIDRNNTVTLRYMDALTEVMGADVIEGTKKPRQRKDPLENVTPVGSYREEKRNLLPFIYVVIGIVVGVAVCFVLIRPTLQKQSRTTGSEIADVTDQISVKETQISALEAEKEDLQAQIDTLQETIDNADTAAQKQTESYEKLIKAAKLYVDGDHLGAVSAVADCKKKDFKIKAAKELYTTISTIPEEELLTLIAQARETINTSYDEAIKQLKAINKAAPNRQDVLYLLGRCYHYKGDTEKAKKYYEKAIAVEAGTEEAVQADRYLTEINGGAPQTEDTDTGEEDTDTEE